jgi:carbon storage regulator
MLVLSRHKDESIMIGDDISIMVVEIRGDKVRLGIDAPNEVPVHRREVYEAIRREEPTNTAGTPAEKTKAERDRLAAIIEVLPKCWRLVDGELRQDEPVVVGSTGLWWLHPVYRDDDPIYLGVCFCITRGIMNGAPWAMAGTSTQHPLSECYNSKEAADAALAARED